MGYLADLIAREPHILVAVRHGQTAYNLQDRLTTVTDVPLTELGEQQAAQMGQALRGTHFDFAHSSPLQRALRTAELSLGGASVAGGIQLDDRLIEPDAGPFEGKVFSELRHPSHPLAEAFALVQHHEPVYPQGFEDPQASALKAASFLDQVAQTPGRHFVASHGALLRIASCVFVGHEPRLYSSLSLANGHAVVFKFYPQPPHQLMGFNLPPC